MADANQATKKEQSNQKRGIMQNIACNLNLKKSYRFGRTIAIFFDDNSVQFATAKTFYHHTRLLNVTKVYIPKSYDSEEKRRNFLVTQVNRYINEFRRPLTRFILGVGGSESAFRLITLPKMSRKEMAEAIYWEGNKRIPFGLDDAYHGYRINGNADAVEKDSVSASFLAVSKKEVDRHLELLDPLEINIDGIHHELEAIGHLLRHIDNFDANKTYALINIKKKSSEISFYRGMRLDFMHVSSVGSENLFGSPDSQTRDEFFAESLDYYAGQFSASPADTVFIYGDLSYSDDLIDNLSDRFGIEFTRFPIDRLIKSQPHIEEFAGQIPASLSTVALAMANQDMINFLPPEIKENRAAIRYIKFAVPSFLLFIAVLLGFWASLKYQIDIESGKLAATYEQIEEFRNSPMYIMYNQIKNQIAADRAILKKLNQEPTFLHLNLKELSRITPDKVKLSLYELDNARSQNGLVIHGQAKSFDPPPEIILAEFVARLESSPFFDNVSLKNHTKINSGGEFVIEFQIGMDAII